MNMRAGDSSSGWLVWWVLPYFVVYDILLLTKSMILKTWFDKLIDCHKGVINRLLHVLGIGLVFVGIFEKSLWLLVVGAVLQEFGHFYEYWRTRDPKSSPWYCFRPQIIFWVIFVLMIVYIIFTK